MITETSDLLSAQAELDRETERLRMRQSEIAVERTRRLEVEHVALIDRCREAQASVTAARAEADKLLREAIRAKGTLEDANRAVSSHSVNRPADSTYPTVGAVEKWSAELANRQTAAAKAEAASGESWGAYHCAQERWKMARETFQVLAESEIAMRSRLHPPRHSGHGAIEFTIFDGVPAVEITRGQEAA